MMKDNIEKSFEEMGLFFKGWKELINKQNILVQKNINAFYKFCINEELAYLSLIKKRENIKNLYINEYKKLDNKKTIKELNYKIIELNQKLILFFNDVLNYNNCFSK